MKISVSGRLFLFLSLGVMTSMSFAQNDYTVIKVYGTITYKKLDRYLIKGDQFKDKEILIFKTNDSRAAVISPEKGRLMITNSSNNGTSGMNFVPGLSNISTRSININSIYDIENEFSGQYLLLNRAKIPISKNLYPQNDESFFFIKYTFNKEEINKKLNFSGDTLVIDVKELLQVDGKPIQLADNSQMKLYYYKNKSSELICEFTAVMPDKEALQKEIAIIVNTYTNKESKFVFDEIKAYLTEFYGKPNDFDLNNWLKSVFLFK